MACLENATQKGLPCAVAREVRTAEEDQQGAEQEAEGGGHGWLDALILLCVKLSLKGVAEQGRSKKPGSRI